MDLKCCGREFGYRWGVRGGVKLLRPEGVAAAAHIIGHKLLIRLLPKLDLRLPRVSTRPLCVAHCAFTQLRFTENVDVAGYRREDLNNPLR